MAVTLGTLFETKESDEEIATVGEGVE